MEEEKGVSKGDDGNGSAILVLTPDKEHLRTVQEEIAAVTIQEARAEWKTIREEVKEHNEQFSTKRTVFIGLFDLVAAFLTLVAGILGAGDGFYGLLGAVVAGIVALVVSIVSSLFADSFAVLMTIFFPY